MDSVSVEDRLTPRVPTQIFPPPILPRDYRPVRRFQSSPSISGLSGVSPALAEALRVSRGHMVKEEPQQGGRHQLDSGQRRALLGEDALQGRRMFRFDVNQMIVDFKSFCHSVSEVGLN